MANLALLRVTATASLAITQQPELVRVPARAAVVSCSPTRYPLIRSSAPPSTARWDWRRASFSLPKAHFAHFINQLPVLFLGAALLCCALACVDMREDLISRLVLAIHFLLVFGCARFVGFGRNVHVQQRNHGGVVLGVTD